MRKTPQLRLVSYRVPKSNCIRTPIGVGGALYCDTILPFKIPAGIVKLIWGSQLCQLCLVCVCLCFITPQCKIYKGDILLWNLIRKCNMLPSNWRLVWPESDALCQTQSAPVCLQEWNCCWRGAGMCQGVMLVVQHRHKSNMSKLTLLHYCRRGRFSYSESCERGFEIQGFILSGHFIVGLWLMDKL